MKVLWFQMWYLIFERKKNGTDVGVPQQSSHWQEND